MLIYRNLDKSMIDELYEIELASFSLPWSKNDFYGECDNNLAVYITAFEIGGDKQEEMVGYAGMWHVINEGHITNIAVKPAKRGMGYGDAMISELIRIAREREMIGITLEVRELNTAALELYKKHGFKPEGLRKAYYEDTKENAVIMWKYLQ